MHPEDGTASTNGTGMSGHYWHLLPNGRLFIAAEGMRFEYEFKGEFPMIGAIMLLHRTPTPTKASMPSHLPLRRKASTPLTVTATSSIRSIMGWYRYLLSFATTPSTVLTGRRIIRREYGLIRTKSGEPHHLPTSTKTGAASTEATAMSVEEGDGVEEGDRNADTISVYDPEDGEDQDHQEDMGGAADMGDAGGVDNGVDTGRHENAAAESGARLNAAATSAIPLDQWNTANTKVPVTKRFLEKADIHGRSPLDVLHLIQGSIIAMKKSTTSGIRSAPGSDTQLEDVVLLHATVAARTQWMDRAERGRHLFGKRSVVATLPLFQRKMNRRPDAEDSHQLSAPKKHRCHPSDSGPGNLDPPTALSTTLDTDDLDTCTATLSTLALSAPVDTTSRHDPRFFPDTFLIAPIGNGRVHKARERSLSPNERRRGAGDSWAA
ncbi:uncharacterized protein EV422DRAFT_564038 [Fimicolochytrium jonesii]|uniref:uncharacterized protein n=1 Tax=Fimicolochytrium jonesii TaxID=1396493 RepID=UPI0022FE4FD7|nr:uncharacterized protein EV422DRAFT_564038 [Fimicolochytrium jonesii]KAI8826227.1 hypothetical protein EV422DRAFT_564038 [Fimicolochytrium jonesii]